MIQSSGSPAFYSQNMLSLFWLKVIDEASLVGIDANGPSIALQHVGVLVDTRRGWMTETDEQINAWPRR